MKKSWSLLYIVIGLLIGASFPLISRGNPNLAGAILAICIVSLVGFIPAILYSNWYIKRGKFNERWLKLLFWSNAVTWLVPVVGFFTALATNQLNIHNLGNDRRKYMLLASIGWLLS